MNGEDNQNKTKKSVKGKDGHWFLVNDFSKLKFISLFKYKELSMNNMEANLIDSSPTTQTNALLNKLNNSSNLNNNNNYINNQIQNNKKQEISEYQQPQQYAITIKENNKLISLYQNKSCIHHNRKNDFYCKNCNQFCCLECFDETNQKISHKNHKIRILDEALKKLDDDSKALDERVNFLKNIIDNEMTAKRNEILKIKNKNTEIVKKIRDLYDKKKMIIKLEEIRRAKILASLGSEVLRIINDYHNKVKYLKLLAEKGDMTNYLANYFLFTKFFEEEVIKNLTILERKILTVHDNFKNGNDKFSEKLKNINNNEDSINS